MKMGVYLAQLMRRSEGTSLGKIKGLKGKSLKWSETFGFGGVVFLCLLVFLIIDFFPPEIPLLYSKPWGSEQLVEKKWLWMLAGIGTGMWFINFLIVRLIRRKFAFLSKLVSWSSVVVILALLGTIIRIGWAVI